MYANADMKSKDIREYCRLDAAGEELLKMAITKLGLSAACIRPYLESREDPPKADGYGRERSHSS